MVVHRDPAAQNAVGGSILSVTKKNSFFISTMLGIGVTMATILFKFVASPFNNAITLGIIFVTLFITAYLVTETTARPINAQPTHYVLMICGSGGHTAEMIQMVERSIRSEQSSHRRWAIGKDDEKSYEKVIAFEKRLLARFSRRGLDSGTFDITRFGRARYVHQSWLTTPFTAILSLFDIVKILVTPPDKRPIPGLYHPGVIVTNGPGTGFLFLLVAQALKLVHVTPKSHMRTIYVESWARVKSLSLTGKLVQRLKLADKFVVQSRFLKGPTNILAENLLVMPQQPPVPFDA